MRIATAGVARGVYVAPWMGPDGEVVLLAITRTQRLAGEPLLVPHGASHLNAADAMWSRLEHDDPIPCQLVV